MSNSTNATVTFMGEKMTLTLTQCAQDSARFDVSLMGMHLGEIHSYTGSLDRLSGNIRIPGKQRTLWMAKANTSDRAQTKLTSRADALRHIIRYATI